MYVGELKEVCSKKLKISDSGDKRLLVPKIVEYLKSGKILTKPAIPDASTAKVHGKDKGTPTKPGNLVLFGVYKNDLVTREYMKTLVGITKMIWLRDFEFFEFFVCVLQSSVRFCAGLN